MANGKLNTLKRSGYILSSIGFFAFGVTAMSLGSGGNLNDKNAITDVEEVVAKLDRVILAEGEKSMTKDIRDIDIDYGLESESASLQMAGTFKEGYCIRITDTGGHSSEKGLTYSVSPDGKLDVASDRCENTIASSPVVAGPPVDERTKTEWELIDTAGWGSAGTFAFLVVGGITEVVRSNKRERREAAQAQIENGTSVSSPAVPETEEAIVALSASTSTPATASPDNLPALNLRIAEVKKEWLEYEMDLVKVLEYPAVTNMSFPATSDFHKAMRHVNVLMPSGIPASTTPINVLSEAVLDLEHKFAVMISEAKRSKWSSFSDDERVSLRTAQNLLSIAVNAASSPNERQIAYKRLIREVEGILVFPEEGILELEALVSLEIEVLRKEESTV